MPFQCLSGCQQFLSKVQQRAHPSLRRLCLLLGGGCQRPGGQRFAHVRAPLLVGLLFGPLDASEGRRWTGEMGKQGFWRGFETRKIQESKLASVICAVRSVWSHPNLIFHGGEFHTIGPQGSRNEQGNSMAAGHITSFNSTMHQPRTTPCRMPTMGWCPAMFQLDGNSNQAEGFPIATCLCPSTRVLGRRTSIGIC